ncbi:hypothetical protein B296_00039264 [Ensete ventricosum]|uniref:Uncharacterized protein n=1 Tax=Ensete ventricosum TaxID=4639 RepID=A0A426XQ08_ENSVE|nr:hypothetical protein B296_00039264 [Ensete ventricosum]
MGGAAHAAWLRANVAPCKLAMGERRPLRASRGRPPLLAALAIAGRPCRCLAMPDRPYKGPTHDRPPLQEDNM